MLGVLTGHPQAGSPSLTLLHSYRNQTPLQLTGTIKRTDLNDGKLAYGVGFGEVNDQTHLKLRAAMHFLGGEPDQKLTAA